MILDAGKFISDPNVKTVLIIILIISLFALAVDIMRRRLYVIFKDKANNLGRKMLRLETPIILMIIVLGIQLVLSKTLRDYGELQTTINKCIGSLLIIIIAYILVLISDLILEKWSNHIGHVRGNHYDGIVPLTKSVINILLSLIALLFILQLWGISITALVASLGIVGVVLGIAFKDAFSNIFAGISLILDDNFRKGELIEFPDGEKGYIVEMNIRSTKIRNLNGMILTVPNNSMANTRLKNYARPNKNIRVKQTVVAPYGSDIKKVENIILDILRDKDGVLDYPKPAVLFTKINKDNLEFEVDFYINDYHDKYSSELKSDVLTEIYNSLLTQDVKLQSKDDKDNKHNQNNKDDKIAQNQSFEKEKAEKARKIISSKKRPEI
jgi:small-conductance mechanosensitive channel